MTPDRQWTANAERQQAGIDAAEVEFFKKLRAAQQPLDVEFKRVLFDNLWELYAR